MTADQEFDLPDWPLPDGEVLEALQQAFHSGDWGRYHCRAMDELEAMLAERFAVRHVLPVCSGTIAVELALRGLRIGAGDEVVLAGYDFPGNFRCIEAVGARPVLVDLQEGSWRIDPEQAAQAVGERTRAMVVSHLHGELADMPALRQIADAHGMAIVEDACQAPGAVIAGRPAGAWGDVGVLSFGGSKLLTAGRGGAILTSRDEVRQRIVAFSQRGNDAFPLSSLAAAVLAPQIGKLSLRNQMRRQAVARLRAALAPVSSLKMVEEPKADWSAVYYKVGLRLHLQGHPKGDSGVGRENALARLQERKAPLGEGFRGFVTRGPSRCRRIGDLTNSRLAAMCTLLLHHPVLLAPHDALDRLAEGIRQAMAPFSVQ